MISLFNINNYTIDTSKFNHILHGNVVTDFEQAFAEYVGAKYACSANSASSLLFLAMSQYKNVNVRLPSTIPIVVPSIIVNTENNIVFYDDTSWVGHSYHLHDNIYDSAQEVTKNQFAQHKDGDILIFSFYPTKPVGSCDGGMVVSNNKNTIDWFKTMTMNGTTSKADSWQRKQTKAGYKMHCSSLQAYIGLKNLLKLDHKQERIDEIKETYNHELGYNNTSRHLYRINVPDNKKFINNMISKGIQCGIHYEHCHDKIFYTNHKLTLEQSEQESKTTVSIPFHEKLNAQEIKKVIECTNLKY